MEREKALKILKALADGTDPATGEQFTADSPYQQPDIVRALFIAVQAVESVVRRERSAQSGTLPENAGHPWSDEEDAELAQAYDSGKAIPELAEAHKRSRMAIEARLARMGKIPTQPYLPSSRKRAMTAESPVAAYA